MQPGGQPHGPAPAQRAPAGRGQPGPQVAVLVGFDAEERVGELGIHVHEAGPVPGHHHRVGQHAGHHVPAVPDHLDDPGVGERVGEGLCGVDEVRARVTERLKAPELHAGPDRVGGQAGGGTAFARAFQAAARGDLPALREGIPDDAGGGLRPALVHGRPPGEGVNRAQDAGLAHREVNARGRLQGAADQVRARVRRADHEDRPVHAAGVNDKNVPSGGHHRLAVWGFVAWPTVFLLAWHDPALIRRNTSVFLARPLRLRLSAPGMWSTSPPS